MTLVVRHQSVTQMDGGRGNQQIEIIDSFPILIHVGTQAAEGFHYGRGNIKNGIERAQPVDFRSVLDRFGRFIRTIKQFTVRNYGQSLGTGIVSGKGLGHFGVSA